MIYLKNINWKYSAVFFLVILFAKIISNAVTYYQNRYLSAFIEIIPDEVLLATARPYLVSIIILTIAIIMALYFYSKSKFKITSIIGLAAFIFNYININIIGESW